MAMLRFDSDKVERRSAKRETVDDAATMYDAARCSLQHALVLRLKKSRRNFESHGPVRSPRPAPESAQHHKYCRTQQQRSAAGPQADWSVETNSNKWHRHLDDA